MSDNIFDRIREAESCPECMKEAVRGDVPVKDLPSYSALVNAVECDRCLQLVIELVRRLQ